MEPQRLSLAGADVARVGLGTNRLTQSPEHVAFIREAVEAGLGLIDTAHVYAQGESERVIGEAGVHGSVVATKGGFPIGDPDAVREELDESLRRLQTDTIGLYYLHKPNPEVPIEESLAPIAEAQAAGKVRSVGVSNVDVGLLERARSVVPVAAVQNHYSYAERGHDEVVDYCTREGIVFVPYFPLRNTGGGAVAEVAARHGATESQVALAWLLHRSPVMLPIPGTLSTAHVRENLAALQLELSDDDLRELG